VFVNISTATLNMTGGEINGNSTGSGISNGGGVYVYSGSATLTETQVISNSASISGGGLYVYTGTLSMTGGGINSNSAASSGGGVFVGFGSATLTGTQVISNSTSGSGGGVYINEGSGALSMTGGGINSNSAASSGGGVYVYSGSATLTETQVISNVANYGGGVFVFLGNGTLSMTGGGINSNSAASIGGGVHVVYGSATLTETQVISNSANSGGGVSVEFGSATLTGTQVLSNVAYSGTGGGFYLFVSSGAIITATNGCIVYNSYTAVVRNNGTLTASDNWWGATNGPSGAGPGDGDSVSANVDYSGFKNSAPAGCPSLSPANLQISKSVSPSMAAPGEAITYTLAFSNIGGLSASGVIITDSIPVSVTHSSLSFSSSGAVITSTGNISYVWNVEDLSGGEWGIINVTGVLSDDLSAGIFTNTATITTTVPENDLSNNSDTASVMIPLPTYTLTLSVDGNGDGSVSSDPAGIDCGVTCTLSLEQDSFITLTAMADTGSAFTGWSGAISTTANPITLTMDAARSVTATFTLEQYTLTTATDGTGTGSLILNPAGGIYEYGTAVTVTHSADTGSTFTEWSGACSGNGSCVVTMDAAKSVTATFTLEQYTLTTATDGNGTGSVSLNPVGGTYVHGTAVTVTHSANTGSTFTEWSGVCSGNGSCVVTMDAAKSVTATFTLEQYTLTTATDGTGTGSLILDPAGGIYEYGTAVTVTHSADAGSTFTEWSGACSGNGSCVVTMDAAKTVTATFTLNSYDLSLMIDGTGTGSVNFTPPDSNCTADCAETYDHGTMVTLTATADDGSTFTGWSGGICSGTDACVITMDEEKNVTATFDTAQFYIFLPVILK